MGCILFDCAPALRSWRWLAAIFRSRRRRYGMESAAGNGIVALSAARMPMTNEARCSNSVKKGNLGQTFSQGKEPENRVGTRPADTLGPGRPFADVPRFATPDQTGRWKVALASGREESASDPDCLAAYVPPDTPFPRQRADWLSLPPPWPRVPPASVLTTATTASPSRYVVAVCPPEKRKRFCRNRRANRDWNKTPAARVRVLWRNQKGRCRKEDCAGSKSRTARSAGKATA